MMPGYSGKPRVAQLDIGLSCNANCRAIQQPSQSPSSESDDECGTVLSASQVPISDHCDCVKSQEHAGQSLLLLPFAAFAQQHLQQTDRQDVGLIG
jgi:hypothetical protein